MQIFSPEEVVIEESLNSTKPRK